jgi:hypothetical protein
MSFGKEFTSEILHIFVQRQTSNTDMNVPFCVDKDEVFLLIRNIMGTHARRVLPSSDTIFNYSLRRARTGMKYTFRMLNKKHIILGKPAETAVNLAKTRVKSACALKNFMKRTKTSGWNCEREIIS